MKKASNNYIKEISKALNLKKQITFSTDLDSLREWDSVGALTIISLADKNYKKIISGDQLEKCKKVEDLIKLFK